MVQIRVTRDDTGSELSNEQLANALRAISGVSDVTIAEEQDGGQRFPAHVGDGVVMLNEHQVLAPAVMFASNKQAEVDAYIDRQRERMGHTTDARHG